MNKAGFLMLAALLSTTLVSTLHPVYTAPTSIAAAPSVSAAPLQFAGQTFVHRWSKDNQNEFTPPEQTDLSAWHEMVTINVYPTVHDGEQLAQLSNAVLANYQQAGKIVRVNSIPATATDCGNIRRAGRVGNGVCTRNVGGWYWLIHRLLTT